MPLAPSRAPFAGDRAVAVDEVTGPVAALATHRDDPSVGVAAAIARSTAEAVVLLGIGRTLEEASRSADTLRLPANRVMVRQVQSLDADAINSALADVNERLLVLTRGVMSNEAAFGIAALRRIPVLVVEPASTTTTA